MISGEAKPTDFSPRNYRRPLSRRCDAVSRASPPIPTDNCFSHRRCSSRPPLRVPSTGSFRTFNYAQESRVLRRDAPHLSRLVIIRPCNVSCLIKPDCKVGALRKHEILVETTCCCRKKIIFFGTRAFVYDIVLKL